MKYIRNIGFLFLIVFTSAQDSKTEKVLFVGNSFTFYFNLPLVVESMADEKGVGLDVLANVATKLSRNSHSISMLLLGLGHSYNLAKTKKVRRSAP